MLTDLTGNLVPVLVLLAGGEKKQKKKKLHQQNVSRKKTRKQPRTLSVDLLTLQSLSTRNGRVHGVGRSDPPRSTGGSVGGGDHAGHGHLPVRGSLKGDNTITMTLQLKSFTKPW